MNQEDPFDQIDLMRQEFFTKGLENGKNEVFSTLGPQSYSKGYEKGKELALELGYYSGIVENIKFLTQILIKNKNRKEKLEKNISELEKLLINFEVSGKDEEDELKELLYIRAKMKILCSLAEIKLKLNENSD